MTLQGRPLLVFVSVFILGGLEGWSSYHATASGIGRLYSVLIIVSSLVFLMLGGIWCLFDSEHTASASASDRAGVSRVRPPDHKPSKALIGFAILTEIIKWILLTQLPAPAKTITDYSALALALVSLATGSAIALCTFTLAGFVGVSLDHEKAGKWKQFPRLARGLKELSSTVSWFQTQKIAALACVFASFLVVTQFFALAVAFDDRAEATPALYDAVPTLTKNADNATASAEVAFGPTSLVLKAAKIPPPARKYIKSERVKFFFSPGDADVQISLAAFAGTNKLCRADGSADLNEMAGYVDRQGGSTEPLRSVVVQNLTALCRVRSWYEQTATSGHSQHIVLFGHANQDSYDGRLLQSKGRHPYISNAELAAVRAQEVMLALNHIAEDVESRNSTSVWPRTQVALASGSSEHAMLDDDSVEGKLSHLDPLVSVEVEREAVAEDATGGDIQLSWALRKEMPLRRLDLLDYLYFMTYTITTTGYGDLMPITPTTKFITTIANLVEVLYLAIIFTVIATRRERYEISKQLLAEEDDDGKTN